MANNKKSNKQKRMEEKKKASEVKLQAEKEKLAKEEAEKTWQEKKRQEKLDKIEEERKERLARYKNAAVILFALAGSFLIGFVYNIYCSMGHPFSGDYEDYYEVEYDHLMMRGRYVRLGVDGVIGWYEGVKDGPYGATVTDADRGRCLLWLDGNKFISLSVEGQKDINRVNRILEGTQAYLDDETTEFPDPVYFTGQIRTMDKVNKKTYMDYCKSTLAEWGLPEEEMIIYELEIDSGESLALLHVASIVYLALAGCFLAAGIVVCIRYHKKKNKKKM